VAENETPQLGPGEPPDTNLWKGLIRQLLLVWRLLFDRRVPAWQKVIPFLSLVYLAIPVDVVPDVLVGLGQLDDLAVIALALKLFVELAPPAVVAEHMDELVAKAHQWTTIDGEAELKDDTEA
jgi:uncharacterized membrane protein YkvA (DUF1232 family)